MKRYYSVKEIDRMRYAITEYLLVTGHHWQGLAPTVEEQLRTYMLNGNDPEELEIRLQEAKGE